MTEKLTSAERDEHLPALFDTGWSLVDGRDAITKRFQFANFVEAFGWMSRTALWAEKLNHHPEWFNVYKNVDVVLATHDCDGLSILDITLARRMDKLANQS